MKRSSRAEYLRRIDRVVQKISESIVEGQPIPPICTLARDAHLSEFHFMRVYRALAGESLGATIQRLRMQFAKHLLANSRTAISDIAARIGYETPQAFAKAFRQTFGIAPTELRNCPDTIVHEGTRCTPDNADVPPIGPSIRIEIVELEPFRVALLRHHGDYTELNRAYAALFEWLGERDQLVPPVDVWGVPHHDRRDTPGSECVFDCCATLATDISGDQKVRIAKLDGGRYAMVRHTGSYSILDDVHDVLLRETLFERRWILRELPILHRFGNDPDQTPEALLETEIYLPIEEDYL